MTWSFNNTPFTDIPDDSKAIGFVYLITNTSNGKRYIGKKNLYATQTRQKTVTLKSGTNKKKKIRSKVESDWRDYFGSSNDVKADLEMSGKEVFKREILRFCEAKGELSYYEAKYQFQYDVLLSPNEWYNNWISCRIQRVHLKNLITAA